MKAGIARKLTTTYFIVTLATVISGVAGTVMLLQNQRANSEIRYNTIPSIELLKQTREEMMDVGRLSRNWIFLAGNRDKAKLEDILFREHRRKDSAITASAKKWEQQDARELWEKASSISGRIVDSAITITNMLPNSEAYMSDSILDNASALCNRIDRDVVAADNVLSDLIVAREAHLEELQNRSGRLLRLMYVMVVASVLVSVMVSLLALRYLKRFIVVPLQRLQKVMLEMAAGNVTSVKETGAKDEIGEMQRAVNRMVGGVVEKVRFAEQLGVATIKPSYRCYRTKISLGGRSLPCATT